MALAKQGRPPSTRSPSSAELQAPRTLGADGLGALLLALVQNAVELLAGCSAHALHELLHEFGIQDEVAADSVSGPVTRLSATVANVRENVRRCAS